jgi:hypothetical protein
MIEYDSGLRLQVALQEVNRVRVLKPEVDMLPEFDALKIYSRNYTLGIILHTNTEDDFEVLMSGYAQFLERAYELL